MADISLCDNEKCLAKDKCWRFTCPPGNYQSYIIMDEEIPEGGCELFWPLDPIKRKEKKDGKGILP